MAFGCKNSGLVRFARRLIEKYDDAAELQALSDTDSQAARMRAHQLTRDLSLAATLNPGPRRQ